MSGFSLDTKSKYAWLAGFDRVNAKGESKRDYQITDHDIDDWIGRTPELSQQGNLRLDEKRDLFLVEQTSMEARFKLLRLAMTATPANAKQFLEDGKKLIADYRARLSKLQERRNSGLFDQWISKEREELRELEADFQSKANVYPDLGGGIGLIFERKGKRVFVKNMIEDGPAQKAGLKVGDEIVKIGGVVAEQKTDEPICPLPISIRPMTIERMMMAADIDTSTKDETEQWKATEIIRAAFIGPPGSQVVVEVQRGEGKKAKTLTFEIYRNWNMFPAMFSPQDSAFPKDYEVEFHKPIYAQASLWSND